tara:strand:+ start:376 stop:546 length:171 start_codon:yes stop_codon:yes gene_type:complete
MKTNNNFRTSRASDSFVWDKVNGTWAKKCKRCEEQVESDSSSFEVQFKTHKKCWTK